MFKLKPYSELVKLAKEAIDEVLAPVRAATAKARANLKIAEIAEAITRREQEVNELAVQKDVDFDRLADKVDEIKLLEIRKASLQEIVDQLFPAQ